MDIFFFVQQEGLDASNLSTRLLEVTKNTTSSPSNFLVRVGEKVSTPRVCYACHSTQAPSTRIRIFFQKHIAHFGKELWPGTQTRRARIYGINSGDANVNKHGGKRSGMFQGSF